MIVGMEEIPQLQPAVCSFLGFGAAPGRKFVRLISPSDVHSDTLLMSDVAFDEIAKLFDYVPASTLFKSVEELRAGLDRADNSLNNLASQFNGLCAAVAELQVVDESVENLRELFDAIRVRVGAAVTEPTVTDEPLADLDGSASDTFESSSVKPLD